MAFWTNLLNHLSSGQAAFVGLVAENTDHSPGTRGAKIFVRPDGSTEGTIGGGVMEADLVERGRTALAADAFEPTYQTLYHRPNLSSAADPSNTDTSGLICAGHQTNVYCLCRPDGDLAVVEDIVARLEADQPGLLKIGPNGLRICREDVISPSRPPIRLVEHGDGWRYEEQLLNWKRAAIIGGGHCGLALSRVLANLGYAVTVFDTRDDVFTFVDNEYARHKVVVDDFAEVGDQIEYPDMTHVIIMTMAQPADVRGLVGTIEGPYPYIGVMGSPAKLAKIRKDLNAEDIDEAHFDRVYAPVGLPMTSNTPDEIAVSIAAELLRERETLFAHAATASS